MSQPASLSGAAYSRTAATTSSLNVSPASINGTSFGHATDVSRAPASSVADERLVAAARDRQLASRAARCGGCASPGRRRAPRARSPRRPAPGARSCRSGQRHRGRGVARDDDHLHAQPLEVERRSRARTGGPRRASAGRTADARGRRGRRNPRAASSPGTRGGPSGRRRRNRRRRSARESGMAAILGCAVVAAPIRIGTCSWADDALSKHWYPPGRRRATGSPTTPSASRRSRSTRPTTACRTRRWCAAGPSGHRTGS